MPLKLYTGREHKLPRAAVAVWHAAVGFAVDKARGYGSQDIAAGWVARVDVVEDVERIHAELGRNPLLPYVELFGDAHVGAEEARAPIGIGAGVTDDTKTGEGKQNRLRRPEGLADGSALTKDGSGELSPHMASCIGPAWRRCATGVLRACQRIRGGAEVTE